MKCGEPKPDSTYQECDRDLQHSGQHEYLGQKWARPELAEPDWDIQSLLDDSLPRGAYGIEERSFPIVVTETVTRVIWVEAENEDQALAYWGDDPTDLSLDGAEMLDGSLEFERPDRWQREAAFRARRYEAKVGPRVQCPGCDALAFRREWFHDPYRKCHGPIEWRTVRTGRAYRQFRHTPVFNGVRGAVAANV